MHMHKHEHTHTQAYPHWPEPLTSPLRLPSGSSGTCRPSWGWWDSWTTRDCVDASSKTATHCEHTVNTQEGGGEYWHDHKGGLYDRTSCPSGDWFRCVKPTSSSTAVIPRRVLWWRPRRPRRRRSCSRLRYTLNYSSVCVTTRVHAWTVCWSKKKTISLPKSTSQSVFPLSSCHWRDLQARWVWQDDPARRWGSRLTLGWFVSLRQVPCAHESHSHVMFVT